MDGPVEGRVGEDAAALRRPQPRRLATTSVACGAPAAVAAATTTAGST